VKGAQVKVKVMSGGRMIREIERPLRVLNGQQAVVFKGKFWELRRGNRIDLNKPPIAQKGSDPAAPPTIPAITRGIGNAVVQVGEEDLGIHGGKPLSGVRDADASRSYAGHPIANERGTVVPEKWDRQQLAVIGEPRAARQLVDAGPGTGKTAVACRRVAWLIDECEVTPSNIWLVSFTRTAVTELRNRIQHYLRNRADVWSVKIATIDSHAWAIHSGFDAHASLTGAHEENIEKVAKLIQENSGVFSYLAEVEHLLVDEAQDIVGPRATMMVELIRKLDNGCGVTVFADEAQAIYSFADDDGGSRQAEGHLPDRLRAHPEMGFRETALSAIYRTDRKHLRKLFTEVRARVLSKSHGDDHDRLERVTEMIRGLADEKTAKFSALDAENHEALRSTFVLFRRRIDALNAASLWGKIPHRIRMSGLPRLVEPWLGAMFWDRTEKKLRKADFEKLWNERIEGRGLTATSVQHAWELLVKTAGECATVVSTNTLRARLGRTVPPSDFVRADFGLGGPVFGTIHGCKGREADSVLLMLPASVRHDSDEGEEARVVFVGATRAKAELRVGRGFKFIKARQLERSNRAYALQTKAGKSKAQVEFGLDGDLTAEGVASRAFFDGPDDILATHQWLLAHGDKMEQVKARAVPDLDWRYRIEPENGPSLGVLSERVNLDLFEIGKDVQTVLALNRRLRPAYGPNHLKTFGAYTIVLHPDDPCRNRLHEPWATSGFMLAPVVQGFDMVYFRPY
jgi:hypothetical protein